MGVIAIFKFIFFFIGLCLCVGTSIYIVKDLKPWRKEVRTKIWLWIESKKKK